jgi:hypothetical protein
MSNALAPSTNPNPIPTSKPVQGGVRRYVQTVPLMRNITGSGSATGLTSPFRVWIPSVGLHVGATIGFRPDSQEDAVIPAGFIATLDAWAKTDRQAGGFPIRGNSIIPGPFVVVIPNQLPWTYEAVTAVDEWRGLMTAPAGGTGLAVTGTFFLTVTWEPVGAARDMPDGELQRLFDSCKVMPGSFPTVFATSG